MSGRPDTPIGASISPGGPFEVFAVDTAGPPATGLSDLLSADERERAERLAHPRDRNAFVLRRAALRRILGNATGTDPAKLCFQTNPNSKPMLAASHNAGDLDFSVSRTDGLCLIALARGLRIGIDVERHVPLPSLLGIADEAFAPSVCAALAAMEDRLRAPAFYRLWTAAEALAKATGIGLVSYPRPVPVTLAADGMVSIVGPPRGDGSPRPATLYPLHLPEPYIGCVVCGAW